MTAGETAKYGVLTAVSIMNVILGCPLRHPA
jgi:hypothetical protein